MPATYSKDDGGVIFRRCEDGAHGSRRGRGQGGGRRRVARRRRRRARVRGRAPAALRRLVAAEGQARPRRDLGAGRAARGRGGGRAALPARRGAPAGRLPRPQGPREGRPLLADGAGRRRGASRPNDEVDEMRWVDDGDGRRRCSATRTTPSWCAPRAGACEPRPLPRPCRRLGAARRPGRHADGRHRDRGDGRRSCAPAAAPTTAACSPPRTRPTSASRRRARRSPAARRRPARRRVRPVDDRDDDAALAPPSAARWRRATRSSSRAWTTTRTCARG